MENITVNPPNRCEQYMQSIDENRVNKVWDQIQSEGLKLTIVMAGKAGAGKTSLVNAIFQEEIGEVSQDGRPCTKKNIENIWRSDVGEVTIIDVPGFGEANAPKLEGLDYQENLLSLGKSANLMLLVLKCDDKALELEEQFLKTWKANDRLSKIPVFIAINQIDKMKPTRDWNPETLDLIHPKSVKEIGINSYIDYVSNLPVFSRYASSRRIFPVSCGEYPEDPQYGIVKLREALQNSTPEMLQILFMNSQVTIDEKAINIIRGTSVICAGIAVQPIPFVDSILLAPPQIFMVTKLAKLRGLTLTQGVISGLVNTVLLSIAGNAVFLSLVKLIPGLGSVIGPLVAFQLTYVAGCIIDEIFKEGRTDITESEAKYLAKKYEKQAKNLSKEYSLT